MSSADQHRENAEAFITAGSNVQMDRYPEQVLDLYARSIAESLIRIGDLLEAKRGD